MREEIIFSQPWGGLGDNLQFSTLPRLYHQAGYDFYISNQNTLRNSEIFNMVWESNPYVKGVSDEPPNAGYPAHPADRGDFKEYNIITAWEKSHGFEDGRPFKTPELYHIPEIVESVRGKTIIELGAVCLEGKYDMQKVAEYIDKNYKDDYPLLISRKDNPRLHNTFGAKVVDHVIEYDKYQDYLNILSSCRNLVCLFSGTAAVASALDPHDMIDKKCLYHRSNFGDMGSTFIFENFEFIEL